MAGRAALRLLPVSYFPRMIDFILHIDKHIAEMVAQYHGWTYGILFGIIFAETGLVFMPFLPGDSLLFAAGTLAHPGRGDLNPWLLTGALIAAAFLGDNVNYFVGKTLGAKLFQKENARFFKRSHLEKTHAFFERHGGKTIILARFVPIVRTFTPFVAGMGAMTYRTFIGYSIAAAVIWVSVCVWAGYFFGGLEIVQKNFSLVVLAIIAISVVPMILEVRKARREARAASSAD